MTKKIVSSGALEKMSLAELTDIYNSTRPPKQVKRFSCIPKAVKAVLKRLYAQARSEADAPQSREKKRGVGSSGRRRTPLRLKPGAAIKESREGSKRHALIEMLREGATLEDVCAKMGWYRRLAREHVVLVNKAQGWGIAEDDAGVIRLTRWTDVNGDKVAMPIGRA